MYQGCGQEPAQSSFSPSHALISAPAQVGLCCQGSAQAQPSKVGSRDIPPNSSQNQCQMLVTSSRALCKQGSALRSSFQMARGSFLLSLHQWQDSHPAEGKQDLLPGWVFPAAACSPQHWEGQDCSLQLLCKAPAASPGLADLRDYGKQQTLTSKGL